MRLARESPCKINLLLNILGKRDDGFHELESVLVPVRVADCLEFARAEAGIELTCDQPALPTDAGNLAHRAAAAFLRAAGLSEGVRIHLQKKVPLAAGLGGGSSNAANTLLGLNELFGQPLSEEQLVELAASLGSDVPFFLQSQPALATGRGERIQPLGRLSALEGAGLVLVHPGFGVSTGWAYQRLARHPEALNGRPGRAAELIEALRTADLPTASARFYNALETPVLRKFPILAMFQEFLRASGATATRMSGSGSTTFALTTDLASAERLADQFRTRFGAANWVAATML